LAGTTRFGRGTSKPSPSADRGPESRRVAQQARAGFSRHRAVSRHRPRILRVRGRFQNLDPTRVRPSITSNRIVSRRAGPKPHRIGERRDLDLGLPDGRRFGSPRRSASCRQKHSALCLTARDAVEDRVRGLDAGADDYLIKAVCDDRNSLPERRRCCAGRVSLSAPRLRLAITVFDTIVATFGSKGTTLQLPRQEIAILEHLMRSSRQSGAQGCTGRETLRYR